MGSMYQGDIEMIEADTRLRYAQCVQIRTCVFVIGQNVPAEREIDQHEDVCLHYVALAGAVPVGTVRWRTYAPDTAKIERLAVLDGARGRGIGSGLMAYLLDDIPRHPEFSYVKLASQDHTIPFYTAMGFEAIGDAFDDGGLPHHDMILKLRVRTNGGK